MRYSILIIVSMIGAVSMPTNYSFSSNSIYRSCCLGGPSSNSIVDFEMLGDDKIFMGSTNSLNLARYSNSGEISFEDFLNHSNMVGGSNPALSVNGQVIAVSGAETIETSTGTQPKGLGVSFSTDEGVSWNYIEQPTDNMEESEWGCAWSDNNQLFINEEDCDNSCYDCHGISRDCIMYNYVSWGGQDNIRNLSVTTEIQNISYDITILGDYIYTANWAGSLRRFNYMDDNPSWEVVPLPMDSQNELICGQINTDSYQVNPTGTYMLDDSEICGYEFDNHKVFSVHSVEDTLWVGTAAGINKGTVDDKGCINWLRMSAEENGFYDDWVIGFEHQIITDDTIRIWAITWDRRYDGSHEIYGGPPSYSDNGGLTWSIAENIATRELITYNISPTSQGIFLSTNEGMFLSENSIIWEKIPSNELIQYNAVYDVAYVDFFSDLWVASSPLEIRNLISGESSVVSAKPGELLADIDFYAYPNPIIGGSFSTFVFNGQEQNMDGTITIYDFSLDRVVEIDASGYTTWDGYNEFGDPVANGMYICNYVHSNNKSYHFNILVINK